ncbi:hypothetical protein [Streptacidiphilus sp. PAMC 29251]
MSAGDDTETRTTAAQAVPNPTGPHPGPPSAVVVAAEEVAEACWRLANAVAATRMPPEDTHQVAGRLLGAADALGVLARVTADDTASSEVAAPGTTPPPWRAVDLGLAAVFHHLYLSIPADHPARQWFIRYAQAD